MALSIQCNVAYSAELVGSGFSYQGELLDNGSPANTQYDIMFVAYDSLVDGNPVPVTPEFLNVEVINGLFNIENVDFGDATYEGKEIFLEVNVRKSSDGGAYSALTPRQRIGATPYSVQSEFSKQADFAQAATNATNAETANKLSAGSASNGDILQFGATGWGPVPFSSINQSPWTLANNNISYTDGNVGVGTSNPGVALHVKSTDSEVTRFSGGDQTITSYYENNIYHGYVGSFQDGILTGTSTDDFEIGTPVSNDGKLHLSTHQRPRLTVDNVGRVGIGEISPSARLEVDGNVLMSPLVVKLEGTTKLKVNVDGRVDINDDLTVTNNLQVNQNIDVDGKLTVNNDMLVNGDTKQAISNNGMLKYMVVVNCNTATSSASIVRSYIGTTTAGSIVPAYENGGDRCQLTFPTDINDRYWVASSNYSVAGVAANCSLSANNKLSCQMGFLDSGIVFTVDGDFTVLVY